MSLRIEAPDSKKGRVGELTTISLKIRFITLILRFFVQVVLLVRLARVALATMRADLGVALWTAFHFLRPFFLNPPNRPFFLGMVRWMHFMANFANP